MDENLILSINDLKSKLLRWKVITLIIIIIGVFVFFAQFLKEKERTIKVPYIARMEIHGTILDDKMRIEKLQKIKNDKYAIGLLISVDSPGGAVIASQDIYNILQEIKQEKPVVISMKNVAASGGYLISLAANRIFAYGSTITGSIGVIRSYFEAVDLITRLGIKPKTFKSSPLKAAPNMWEKETKENGEIIQNIIKDHYMMFAGLVQKDRNMECSQLKKVANGAIFSGTRALDLGLIDQLGNEEQALQWMRTEYNIEEKTKIINFFYIKEESVFKKFFGKINMLLDNGLYNNNYQLMAII